MANSKVGFLPGSAAIPPPLAQSGPAQPSPAPELAGGCCPLAAGRRVRRPSRRQPRQPTNDRSAVTSPRRQA